MGAPFRGVGSPSCLVDRAQRATGLSLSQILEIHDLPTPSASPKYGISTTGRTTLLSETGQVTIADGAASILIQTIPNAIAVALGTSTNYTATQIQGVPGLRQCPGRRSLPL